MFGALGLSEILLVGTWFVVWFSALIACASTESGDRRVAWMIAVVFVPVLGAVAYLVVRVVPRLAASGSRPGVPH